MEKIPFLCPGCATKLRIKRPLTAGKRIRCPKCGFATLYRASQEKKADAEVAGDSRFGGNPETIGAPLPLTLTAPPALKPEPDNAVPTALYVSALSVPSIPGYQILQEIAHGGMGQVLRGRDPRLGREIAIKILRSDRRTDAELIRRFVAEAQICGQLQHPGIVPVHELGQMTDGNPFFTMKLVHGHTLAALLAERPNPWHELPRFYRIFEQLAQTLAYAHSRGVIHRDLKPQNVMVGQFGELQVMDWGLSKVLGTADEPMRMARKFDGYETLATQDGAVFGTPTYMAPEQARGEIDRLDERCDVFALGGILCEILTGHPPYPTVLADGTKRRPVDVLRDAATCNLEMALQRLEECTGEQALIDLTRQCLAMDLEVRPRNAQIVVEGITSFLASVQEDSKKSEIDQAASEVVAEAEARTRAIAGRLIDTEEQVHEALANLRSTKKAQIRYQQALLRRFKKLTLTVALLGLGIGVIVGQWLESWEFPAVITAICVLVGLGIGLIWFIPISFWKVWPRSRNVVEDISD
jgi:serine/threonine protein kinase